MRVQAKDFLDSNSIQSIEYILKNLNLETLLQDNERK